MRSIALAAAFAVLFLCGCLGTIPPKVHHPVEYPPDLIFRPVPMTVPPGHKLVQPEPGVTNLFRVSVEPLDEAGFDDALSRITGADDAEDVIDELHGTLVGDTRMEARTFRNDSTPLVHMVGRGHPVIVSLAGRNGRPRGTAVLTVIEFSYGPQEECVIHYARVFERVPGSRRRISGRELARDLRFAVSLSRAHPPAAADEE